MNRYQICQNLMYRTLYNVGPILIVNPHNFLFEKYLFICYELYIFRYNNILKYKIKDNYYFEFSTYNKKQNFSGL